MELNEDQKVPENHVDHKYKSISSLAQKVEQNNYHQLVQTHGNIRPAIPLVFALDFQAQPIKIQTIVKAIKNHEKYQNCYSHSAMTDMGSHPALDIREKGVVIVMIFGVLRAIQDRQQDLNDRHQ